MPTHLPSSSSLLTGAILAGGHSSRFGSNKALFAPDGETLISKAADLLRPLTGEVLVSASPAHAGTYDFLGLEIVEDLHPDSGPLGGLEALLQRCSTPWLLVLTCDMPFVDSDALLTMIRHALQPQGHHHGVLPRALAWRRCDGSISPFPLLIEQDALAILQGRIRAGKLSMKGLLCAVDTYYITSPSDRLLSNINRPEDWTDRKFSKDNIANT
ncbi:molybdenum cofactor guanylyltransferase [Hallella mizrahii]|uniref:Probable molybdenum cofactor guanylyltransferase n=1 Tax=Hallella mizrahii TaxID=2606637 RepID=A0A7K0KE99_9BACT|nr:molybdenum cofactor guanylyltransferase [Hallella mizrahii]MST84256.1 molybdenum cofactor guanylyltransferase [Hallella mizrahii]